jgi:hypothetical protein
LRGVFDPLGEALAFEVTLDQSVVRFGDVLDQGLPLCGHLILQIRGNFSGFAFPVLAVDVRLLGDEVDHSFELGLCSDRHGTMGLGWNICFASKAGRSRPFDPSC